MAKPDVDPELVRKLAQLIDETNLTEIEYQLGDLRIRVARQPAPVASALAFAPPAAAAAAAPSAVPAVSLAEHPGAITSPMVGTAYVAPEPGAPSFVKVGDQVRQGQTLLIIEAMKVMNPLPAPKAGRVAQVLVSDAQPVEFGEVLLIIE